MFLRYLLIPYQLLTYKAQKDPRIYESLYAPQKFIVVVKGGELKIHHLQMLQIAVSTAKVKFNRINSSSYESSNQQKKLLVKSKIEDLNHLTNCRSYVSSNKQ